MRICSRQNLRISPMATINNHGSYKWLLPPKNGQFYDCGHGRKLAIYNCGSFAVPKTKSFIFVHGVTLRSCEAVQLFTQWNTLIFQLVTLKSPLNSTISSYINTGKEQSPLRILCIIQLELVPPNVLLIATFAKNGHREICSTCENAQHQLGNISHKVTSEAGRQILSVYG